MMVVLTYIYYVFNTRHFMFTLGNIILSSSETKQEMILMNGIYSAPLPTMTDFTSITILHMKDGCTCIACQITTIILVVIC